MPDFAEVRPLRKKRIMDLVSQTGIDVTAWAEGFRGTNPASNPHFCHNWSFEKPGSHIVLCLWYEDMKKRNGYYYQEKNYRTRTGLGSAHSQAIRAHRAEAADKHIQRAAADGLPVRVIILRRRSTTLGKVAVGLRELDATPWSVTSYNLRTGKWTLKRGTKPVAGLIEHPSASEFFGFEGQERVRFVRHRKRENRARALKIAHTLMTKNGRLVCEVPKCNFDFKARYGEIGEGYAQVHHLQPLSQSPKEGRKVNLKMLAIVCANCHAMIHINRGCRPLKGLIAHARA